MRTTIFLTIALLFGSLYVNAGINPTVKTAYCLVCETPAGLIASDLAGASAALSWDAVAGASQYTVEVEDEQNVPSTFHIEVNVQGTSYTVTGLQAGVSYKFKVRAKCGGDNSDWSDWVSFASPGDGNGGGDCAIPAGLSASVGSGSAALSWDAVPGAVKYYIEIEDEQNNPSTFHLEDSSATNSYTVSGLQAGVLYKFKVRAKCANGQSDWSTWQFFNGTGGGNGGGDCAIPVGLSANVGSGSAALSWDAVPGAVKYYIEIEDEQNNPGTFHLEDSSATNSYTVSGLQAGVLYKFKVRAKCANGQSDWSAWQFFNGTGGGNGGGDCVAPTQLSAAVTGTTATLSWNTVTGAILYYLEVEDEQNVPSTFHLEDSSTTNSYTLTGLQAGVLYKFKVRTKCAGGQSDWSAWQFFNGVIGNPGGGGGTGNCVKPTGTAAVDITANSALLVWNPVPGVASYTLEIERVNPGSTPFKITAVVTTNSYAVTGLLSNTRYKFKVRSNCSADSHSKWTGWRKFRTLVSLADSVDSAAKPEATDRVAGMAGSFSLQLWPNPVQTTATVRLNDLNAESATLRLFDLAGQLVQERTIQPENGAWQGALNLGDLPNGVYLLQARTSQNTQTLKMVLSH